MKCINCEQNDAVEAVAMVFDGLCHECKQKWYRTSMSRPTKRALETAAPCEHMACEPVMLCMDCGEYFD